MFIELGRTIFYRYPFPNKDVEALVYMVVVPTLVLLRICAIFGMLFPFFRTLYNLFFERRMRWDLFISTIVWGVLNFYLLRTDVDPIWKWIWVDYMGMILFINTISFYIYKQITRSK